MGRVGRAINKPFDLAGSAVMHTPLLGAVIEHVVNGLVSVTNDLAQRTVRPRAILEGYRLNGHPEIDALDKISTLDLEEVDKQIGWLGAKYKGIATVEGAATGAAGVLGIAPDIVALVTLNLRAIGEYATYCGFDMSLQQERLFAITVLGAASTSGDANKATAMAQLAKLASDISRRRTWKELERQAFVKIIQRIARAIGIRLTKAKLAQVVPVTGALIGAGFNAHFTSRVCDTSFHAFRERFLDGKYSVNGS